MIRVKVTGNSEKSWSGDVKYLYYLTLEIEIGNDILSFNYFSPFSGLATCKSAAISLAEHFNLQIEISEGEQNEQGDGFTYFYAFDKEDAYPVPEQEMLRACAKNIGAMRKDVTEVYDKRVIKGILDILLQFNDLLNTLRGQAGEVAGHLQKSMPTFLPPELVDSKVTITDLSKLQDALLEMEDAVNSLGKGDIMKGIKTSVPFQWTLTSRDILPILINVKISGKDIAELMNNRLPEIGQLLESVIGEAAEGWETEFCRRVGQILGEKP